VEKGGHGGDFYSNIIGLEEQIYNMVPGLFNLQSDLVMPYVAHYGTDDQIENYMHDFREGKKIGCLGKGYILMENFYFYGRKNF
jgi:alkylation response protein AidB-like acyl-CoA dehydrogenase